MPITFILPFAAFSIHKLTHLQFSPSGHRRLSLRRLTTKPDVVTTSGRGSRIYDFMKRPFYVVLKMSNLRRLEDV